MINLLGLLKNKPSLIIYQMQIDGQKVLASFYESFKKNLGIKGLMFFDIYLWLFVINLLGLLKNKPGLIIYQMQIDD